MANEKRYFRNRSRGTILAQEANVAKSFFARLKGLLGTRSLAGGAGLLIVPCNQIHMFGMQYAIDAVFVDPQNKIVGLVKRIGPGQVSRVFRKAHACLELPAGTIDNTMTEEGDELEEGSAPYEGGGPISQSTV